MKMILFFVALFISCEMKAQLFTHATSSSSALEAYDVDTAVVYTSCDSISLAATLTMPKHPVCAVVMMTGTGQQDRDCTMAGHPVFAEIADYLSSRGIAVLRSDDRGVGKSTGHYDCATTNDFAADALAAVKYLKTVKQLKKLPVGLIGHSEGGASVSIAASRSKDVAFVASLAGLMSDGLSSVIKQNKDIIAAANMSDEMRERFNEIDSIMFNAAYEYAESDTLDSVLYHKYDEWKMVDDARFQANHPGEMDHFRFSIYMYVHTATSPWYRFFIRYNPADYLSKVNVPVLAINGDKDVMVNCDMNLSNVKRYLAHNPHVTTKVVRSINHLLLPCEKGTQDEYAQLKDRHVSDELMQCLYEWISSVVK